MTDGNGTRVQATDQIAEDQALMCQSLRDFLQIAFPDCNVQVAADGASALEACKTYRPNLVLIDKCLPDADGITAAHRAENMNTSAMDIRTPSPNASFKILIAEDSRTQAQALQHMLEEEGYGVVITGNGRLALEAASSLRPDLIISDVNMPEMDGYELSRRIKADRELRDIPVILVTAMSDPQDVIRGLECGADNFILKPYEGRYLFGRVRYVLANREVHRPDEAGMGVSIHFNGQRHYITADRLQILNLLLSTYDAAIQRNKELEQIQESLEKRSSECALANHFLDSVIENIPHMIFVKDAEELRYVRVNRAVEELVGFTMAEMLGKGDHDFFPPEEANFFTAKDREALAGATNVSFDQAIHTRTKGVRILHTKKLAIHDELNRPRYLLGISEDITEKKEREREILRLNAELEKRTAEADAASMAKSDFLATMSHEIRTPMNGMLGMLELFGLSRLDAEQRATLEIVCESSQSLLRIVDDILDISKIEAGKLEICPEACSIKKILKDVVNKFGLAARSKGLEIGYDADPGISPALVVDPMRLEQILGNFVSNSIKFTTQGTIEIRSKLIGYDNAMQQIRFLVSDTGTGISPEGQRRLFQPFSQGQPARVAGGTGLGLTICRRLAGMMGGSVEMASELGKGTTMALNLSLASAPLSDVTRFAISTGTGPDGKRARVRRSAPRVEDAQVEGTLALVVDDHPVNRLLLTRQLNTLGYAVESAASSALALELWKSGRFGIVITDCEMPGMSGYELAKGIRALEPHGSKRIPIIACTAHAMMGEIEKCLSAGMDDCMTKPIDLAGLLEKMENWLPIREELATQTGPGEIGPASGPSGMPIDLALIGMWGDGAETVNQILEFFMRSNEEDAARLREAVAKVDLLGVTETTHRILGASKMVGAHDLAEAAEKIDLASKVGDWNNVLAGMSDFEQEMSRLHSYISAR